MTIKDWHLKLDKYDPPNDDDHNREEILKDENWLKIVEEGFAMRTRLEKFLNNTKREILNQEFDYLGFEKKSNQKQK